MTDIEKDLEISNGDVSPISLPESPSKKDVPNSQIGEETNLQFEALANGDNLGVVLSRSQTQDPEERPKCFKTTFHEVLFTATATLAIAQTSILGGVISGLISHIAADLGMTQAEVTWINAASSLAAGSFLMFFGSVADQFGRRWMLLLSMGAYSLLCLVIGFASNPVYMDVLSALLGLCSAAAVPPAIGILGATYKKPSKRKNMVFACFSAGNPLGFVVGVFISGVCFRISTWRTPFWVLSVLYALFTVAAYWSVPTDDIVRAKFNLETLKKFDFLGVLLAASGIALFTTALTIGGDAPNGWRTAYVLVILILGAVLIGLFVYWESLFANPLMPLAIWKDKNFSLLIVIMCLGFAGFSGNIFWTSLFFQEVENVDPLGVAIRLLPQAIAGIMVNVIAGLIMHRVSNKLLMAIGALGFTSSFALFSAFDYTVENSYWKFLFPAFVLSVIGADFEFTVTNMYVMSSLPSDQQARAGGLFNTVTRLSTSIGLGISTAAYSAVNDNSSQTSTNFAPYRATWWVALGLSGASLFFLPFLTIKPPGGRKKMAAVDPEE